MSDEEAPFPYRLNWNLRSVVICRSPSTNTVWLGGLGGMGLGVMSVPDSDHYRSRAPDAPTVADEAEAAILVSKWRTGG